MAYEETLKKTLDSLLQSIDDQSFTIPYYRGKNTMGAVNTFLKCLLDKDTVEAVEQRYQTNKTNTNKNRALPTYNVRTPIVYVWINEIPVFPFDNKESNIESKYTGIYFDGLDVTYPLGGVETNVDATLKLYAKDPGLILDAIEGRQTDKVFDVNNTSNLPLVTLQWGWKFAVNDDPSEIKEVLTPAMNFIILNIEMTNPDNGGVTFTFRMRDIGNTMLKFSRKTVAVDSNYPQEQIRYIIEGLLNFRLFTLDDLLNLTGRLKDKNDQYGPDSRTFFVNDKLGTTCTNNHNYLTVCERLSYLCKCRWTSTPNEQLKDAMSVSAAAETKAKDLELQIEQLRQTKTSTNQESVDKKLKELQEELNSEYANMALSCKLYWVDNVPPEFRTLSNDYYIKDEETKKETGAFFLLPDLSHVDGDSSIPLCYGPGASTFPYLHGSAQNVFNASIDEHSCTFGDVMSVSCRYDNMIQLLKSSIHEQATVLTDSQYNKLSNGVGSIEIVNDTPMTKAESDAIASSEAKLQQENATVARTSAREQARTNFRCFNACSPTGVIVSDIHSSDDFSDSGVTKPVRLEAVDKQYYNISNAKEFASMSLRSRVNFFLKYPLAINMTVFGDPTLIRMGVGGFELLSYYITEDGSRHNLNTFLSGVYVPLKITHRITYGDYVCDISGLKQNKIARDGVLITKIVETNRTDQLSDGHTAGDSNEVSQTMSQQALQVDLQSDTFTQGFLANALKDLYNKTKR